ncbi:PAX3- and PAX7-binding protein 1-like [Pyrus ussuriensis x Pyrus communis]|uniref:PAX3-and PAX7-binding protein 1-like n=1 Tax=Pyrus ussuriensis x Pyrus communis TaxID=2448454 RepID=A0A5N5H8J2_9ROSA|nr:PAX3- and PAX7-binding protein 1-like [Pyrus ussuriensis x Pyrus communis]
MSSRSRNFRRRADDGDDQNDDANDTTTAVKSSSKPSSASSSKPKKPQNQAPKLLSFVDDEENAAAPSRSASSSKREKPSSRLGKPSSAHKLTALKDRLAHSSSASTSVSSNVQPQAGTYTKEALRELQKNTRTLASSRPSSEPTIVLKGLVKPTDSISDTLREARELDSDSDEKHEKERGSLFNREKDDAEARLASMGIDKGKSSPGLFPDQATIDAIRAKRERLRKSRAAAPDFISLDSGSNHGAAEGLSDEEPEFRGRIAMFGDKMDGSKKGVFEDVDDRAVDAGLRQESVEDGDEEDEEEKIWEEEQFRKGLGKRVDDGVVSTSALAVPSVPQPKATYSAVTGYSLAQSVPVGPSIGGAIGASQGSNVMSIKAQADIARKALEENFMKLKASHGRTMLSLTKTDENLSASLLNITALEKSLSAADEKYQFMQKLRDFVSSICDFLQVKAPYIEELEAEMQKVHEQRASSTLERRSADDDEMMEVEAAVKAAMSIFSKEGSSAEVIAAAKSAAQAASAALREQTNLPVKLDEFGRDMNLKKRMDMKGRYEARQRRKVRYDSKRLSSMDVDSSHRTIEGESSTDESDSESQVYHKHRQLVLDTAGKVFDDAAEEYSQLSVVKERFEDWKREYASSYRDAYMSLSVPTIFSPYVRLELLKWDPLRDKTDFLNMNWHSLLMDYGLLEDGNDLASDDADANLVPDLVEKVALPILHHQVVYCWNILSMRETENVVAATSLVTDYVPPSSEALADLLGAIRTRLADAVTNLTVPTWSPLVLTAVPDAARLAAYRFGMSVRLMKNICLWKEILASPILEKLAIEELLCGKVLPHVRSIAANVHDAVTRTERIVASLSGVWAGSNVTGDRSRKLQSLVDYVLSLGRTLEKKHSLGVTQSETGGLARRLKKMLVDLNQYDKARDIARTFNLKEAL